MGVLNRAPNRKTLILLAVLSVLLLVSGAVGAWLVSRSKPGEPLHLQVTPPPSLSELAAKYPEYADILMDPELDSTYKDFLVAYNEGGIDKALLLAKERGILSENGDLRLVLETKTEDNEALKKELTGKGFRVGAASDKQVDVLIPKAVLEEALKADDPAALFKDMTSLEQVRRVRIPLPAAIDAEPVSGAAAVHASGEGARVIGANAWQELGITGKGVKVGILDLGFRGYRDYLGAVLPADITGKSFVLDTELNETQTEHGAACAEIIHSIAPDAQLYLAAYRTEAEMGEAVNWLLDQGVQVISNSTGTAYGPLDGSAAQSQMVDQVTSRGVLWINSAGNFGMSHYRGAFTDTDGNHFHEFAPGQDLMAVEPNGTAALVLNWDDWGGGSEDYSLFLFDKNMQEIASSREIQDGPGADAAEAIVYPFSGKEIYYVAIRAEKITRSAVFDFFVSNGQIEFPSAPYSVSTPGDARTSLTVGAVHWTNSALEPYSSEGPTHDERSKPDISAPASVPSVVYGKEFAGTSASAPHVAGAAALVLQANPGFTPGQVRDFLLERSIDLGNAGPDIAYGSGALWLGDPPGALAAVPTPTSLPAARQPTRPVATIKGKQPGGKAGTSLFQTLGLVCAFGLGLAGLFGFGLAVILLLVAQPAGKPVPAYPPQQPGRPSAPPQQQPPRPLQPPQPRPQARPRAVLDGAAIACPRCGSSNRAGARFCSRCGAPLAKEMNACRYCGTRLRPGSRFCPHCGQPVPSENA